MERPIVVVDDEPGVLEVVRDLLELEGYPVLCCDHPGQVVSVTEGTQPSLFLIDIMLPGTSGIELAEQLRANDFRQTPCLPCRPRHSWSRPPERPGSSPRRSPSHSM